MKLSKIWKDQKNFDICFRNEMSEIPVKNHGKKPNKFMESRNKFVWNYTELNENHSLPAGSGVNWIALTEQNFYSGYYSVLGGYSA